MFNNIHDTERTSIVHTGFSIEPFLTKSLKNNVYLFLAFLLLPLPPNAHCNP